MIVFACNGCFVIQKIKECGKCICRKNLPSRLSDFVNIFSAAPVAVVCVDFLSLERSKGGFENIQLLSKIFIDSDFCHNYLHTIYLFECL